ncbi:transketolase C-terminal domain-containing protein [Salinibacterium sp. ZJ77]|uniref:alpha-ketoacid dehydrogenase subunit beta n=1 Tax=Salinibacterium sp. ZJ77 TaxID=2708337 RepID=UPI00141DA133|nr:transketolase C-terminal domain-containing protein [Salinibacterium sp. ZJ77]
MTTTTRARRITLRDAVNEAIIEAMRADERVILMGEDVAGGAGMEQYDDSGSLGGVFGVTRGVVAEFGRRRVIDTPLAETALMGAAVGAAASGLRPIVELMFIDFIGTCLDPILNQGSRLRYMSNGQVTVPLVVRSTYGAGLAAGPHHSGSYFGLLAHLPGVKLVVPANAADARDIFGACVDDDNLVFFLENTAQYSKKEAEAPRRALQLGVADTKRAGTDVTVVAIGAMVGRALAAAEQFSEQGVEVEVIDPITLVPLDMDAIIASVRRTGRLVVVDEDNPVCSVAEHIISTVAAVAFDALTSAPVHVAPPQVPVPYGPVLEAAYLPDAADISAGISKTLG